MPNPTPGAVRATEAVRLLTPTPPLHPQSPSGSSWDSHEQIPQPQPLFCGSEDSTRSHISERWLKGEEARIYSHYTWIREGGRKEHNLDLETSPPPPAISSCSLSSCRTNLTLPLARPARSAWETSHLFPEYHDVMRVAPYLPFHINAGLIPLSFCSLLPWLQPTVAGSGSATSAPGGQTPGGTLRCGPSTPWRCSYFFGCVPCPSPCRRRTGSGCAQGGGRRYLQLLRAVRRWSAAGGSFCAGTQSGWAARSCPSAAPCAWCSWRGASGGCTPAGPGGPRTPL